MIIDQGTHYRVQYRTSDDSAAPWFEDAREFTNVHDALEHSSELVYGSVKPRGDAYATVTNARVIEMYAHARVIYDANACTPERRQQTREHLRTILHEVNQGTTDREADKVSQAVAAYCEAHTADVPTLADIYDVREFLGRL